MNAEFHETIAQASVYEEEAQLEIPSPLPTNSKTVIALLQYPEHLNAFECVCVTTHNYTNNLFNPVAVIHNIDVATQNVSGYFKSNVLDRAPFQLGSASY